MNVSHCLCSPWPGFNFLPWQAEHFKGLSLADQRLGPQLKQWLRVECHPLEKRLQPHDDHKMPMDQTGSTAVKQKTLRILYCSGHLHNRLFIW